MKNDLKAEQIETDLEALNVARASLLAEADAIRQTAQRLNGSILKAAGLVLAHPGKIIVTGVGKSGQIAQKIAATLCSTGTPAIFLHPGDAVHGDLGVYTPGDPTLLVSKSGTTAELVRLIPVLRRFQSPLVGILGNLNSPLARQVDVVLDARVEREADPLNLAPTASSTVALALGDALAAVLMHLRQFDEQDFARLHPSGQLGRDLQLRVADVMHSSQQVAQVDPETSLRQVVIAMTQHPLGAACVVDENLRLEGIITDGDVRRSLQQIEDIRTLRARQVMTSNPITVSPQDSLAEAVRRMENRPSQISVLPVVDEDQRCLGLIRIHDIYQVELGNHGS